MIMNDRKFPLFRSLLWAVTLAIGFGTLWAWLAAMVGAAIEGAREGNRIPWEQLFVRSDGTVLIMSTPRDNLSLATFRDLAGRTQDAPDQSHRLPGVSMTGTHGPSGIFDGEPGWEHRIQYFINEQEPTVHWFFVHDGKKEGAGYFVGYERTSNRRVGFIGLRGFRPHPVPFDEWLPVSTPLIRDDSAWSSAPISILSGPLWLPRALRPDQWDLPPHRVYVPSGNLVRLADLANRTVTTVYEAQQPIESLGIPALSTFAGDTSKMERPILVRTAQQIQTLNRNHQVTRSFAIPTEADRQSAVTWYEVGNGQAIAEFYRPGETRGGLNVSRSMFYRVGDDGTIQEQFEVLLQSGALAMGEQMGSFLLALAMPAPTLVVVLEPFFLVSAGQAGTYPAALRALVARLWPSLLFVFSLSLILAVMTKRRSRAYGLSFREQVAWSVLIFLFGLLAYAGFLLSRRWPTRQPCPHCGALAPRDRTACTECGSRFPEPALTGIEISA